MRTINKIAVVVWISLLNLVICQTVLVLLLYVLVFLNGPVSRSIAYVSKFLRYKDQEIKTVFIILSRQCIDPSWSGVVFCYATPFFVWDHTLLPTIRQRARVTPALISCSRSLQSNDRLRRRKGWNYLSNAEDRHVLEWHEDSMPGLAPNH